MFEQFVVDATLKDGAGSISQGCFSSSPNVDRNDIEGVGSPTLSPGVTGRSKIQQ